MQSRQRLIYLKIIHLNDNDPIKETLNTFFLERLTSMVTAGAGVTQYARFPRQRRHGHSVYILLTKKTQLNDSN